MSSFKSKDYYAGLLSNPNVQAALEAIAYAEGTAKAANPYSVGYNYNAISDLSKHPGKTYGYTQFGPTSAAGKYQATKTTWGRASKALGLDDFSPKSQDIFAVAMMDVRGVLDDVVKGNVVEALSGKNIGNEWTSLPAGPQSRTSKASIQRAVDGYMASITHGPIAPIDMAQPATKGYAVPTSALAGIPTPTARPASAITDVAKSGNSLVGMPMADLAARAADYSVAELSNALFTPTEIGRINDVVKEHHNPAGLAKGLPEDAGFIGGKGLTTRDAIDAYAANSPAGILSAPEPSFNNQGITGIDGALAAAAAQKSTSAADYGFQDVGVAAQKSEPGYGVYGGYTDLSTAAPNKSAVAAPAEAYGYEDAAGVLGTDYSASVAPTGMDMVSAPGFTNQTGLAGIDFSNSANIAGNTTAPAGLGLPSVPGNIAPAPSANVQAVAPKEEAINPQTGLTPSKEKALDREIGKMSAMSAPASSKSGIGGISKGAVKGAIAGGILGGPLGAAVGGLIGHNMGGNVAGIGGVLSGLGGLLGGKGQSAGFASAGQPGGQYGGYGDGGGYGAQSYGYGGASQGMGGYEQFGAGFVGPGSGGFMDAGQGFGQGSAADIGT